MPRQQQKGFTLVEMLVVAPVVILAIGAFLAVIINMTGEVLASRASNIMTYTTQDALLRIEQDIKQSTTFLAQNNIVMDATGTANPQGYSTNETAQYTPFKNAGGTMGNALILNMLVTDKNPIAGDASVVYLTNQPNACGSAQTNRNTPLTMNVVYYTRVENGVNSLFRRTIMPKNYTVTSFRCTTPWQLPSCNARTNGTMVHTFCKALDEKLVDNVTSDGLNISYFATANTTLPDVTASSLVSTDAARGTSLLADTSARVTIKTSRAVAGRDVTHESSIRATRLETNASTINALAVNTNRPAQPTVTATTNPPTGVTFSWPAVPEATGYKYSYTVNGTAVGGTTTVNANTRSFTVNTATHADTVVASVMSVRSTAATPDSIASTASVTVPLWAPYIFQNNWNDYGYVEWGGTGYTKTSSGMVMLKGMIARNQGTNANNEILFTLPVGYRPAISAIYQNISNGANVRIDIHTNGDVRIQGTGHGAWVNLNGIAFYPSGNTFTSATPYSNNWITYTGAPWVSAASYYQDTTGERVEVRGMVSSGNTADNTAIWNLPTTVRPPQYMHLPAQANGTDQTVGISTSTGNVVAKGYAGSSNWYSIHAIYPYGRASGTTCTTQWCNLSFQNSWANYGGEFTTGQYTKTSDGVVSLKGLIRNGSTSYGNTIAVLPAGYRPTHQLMYNVRTNTGMGRMDIYPDGRLVYVSGTNPWYSLDGINFLAEQ